MGVETKTKLRPARAHDWRKNPRGLTGGHVKEFPLPVAWYWPRGRELRHARCSILSWVGGAPGAVHYYGRVREEDNFAWNGERWAEPWDAPHDQKGRSFDSKGFLTRASAQAYVNRILKKHFSIETHTIEYMGDNRARPGAYLTWKDGD